MQPNPFENEILDINNSDGFWELLLTDFPGSQQKKEIQGRLLVHRSMIKEASGESHKDGSTPPPDFTGGPSARSGMFFAAPEGRRKPEDPLPRKLPNDDP